MKKRVMATIALSFISLMLLCACGSKKEEALDAVEETLSANAQETGVSMVKQEDDEPHSSAIMERAEKPNDEEALREKIAGMQITYTFGDNIETLPGSTIKEWLITLPDGTLSVNEAPAKDYIAGLASKYDTFGQKRSFVTHAGNTISVAGGNYGYWMDRVNTRYELIDQILTGESAALEPVYYGKGQKFGTDDIGNTYVEINIGEQHLWVYKNGNVVNESDFVSGGLFKGNNTPDGVFAITYKERDATLVGENYQSSVKYWMPFNGNIGMHDASWRDQFGGHIYYMSGSHGCVNLPTAKAAAIYDQVEKGEPVIVYGGISKETAISRMTPEEQLMAMQKGYITMTPEMAAYLMEQQSTDAAAGQTPEALTQADPNAGQAAQGGQEAQQQETQQQETQQPENQQPENQQPETQPDQGGQEQTQQEGAASQETVPEGAAQ